MTELVNCIECGKKVSNQAENCPHCGKKPKTNNCLICDKPIQYSRKIHLECCGAFSCPACNNISKYSNFFNEDTFIGYREETVECSNCGHPLHFDNCYLCKYPVLREEAKIRDNGECDSNVYHRLCYKKRTGCFIATEIYNSPIASEVLILKEFRDNIFMSSNFGQKFIKFYYHISPTMADFLSKHSFLKRIIRYVFFEPLLFFIKKYGKTKL
ncbi:hypothetical protein QUF74_18225 [Candidatus Halobeggiatoa sp. HSG11]|nr:hypothetical protein [Candidatus Halobeggiatoa sp. HSG11]